MSFLSKLFIFYLGFYPQVVLSTGAKINSSVDGIFSYPIRMRNFSNRPGLESQLYSIHKNEFSFLITGGMRPADSGLHKYSKYIVSIRLAKHKKFIGDNHWCAGVIIAPTVILSVAHCTFYLDQSEYGPQDLRVVAGTQDRLNTGTGTMRVRLVDKIIWHTKYDEFTMKNDIGMFKLCSPFEEDGRTIGSIPLATRAPQMGLKCTTLGWGKIFLNGPSPNRLLFIDIDIWPTNECLDASSLFIDGMLCAACKVNWDMDACTGDSGGPLICGDELVGLVSFGIACATPGYPGYYTDVYYHRKWIAENANNAIEVQIYISFLSMIFTVAFSINFQII